MVEYVEYATGPIPGWEPQAETLPRHWWQHLMLVFRPASRRSALQNHEYCSR
jgi:hypothetical protein